MIRQLVLSEAEPGADVLRSANPGAFTRLTAEFPTVALRVCAQEEAGPVMRLEAPEWRAPGFDPSLWDERIFSAAANARAHEGLRLHITGAPGPALAATAMEMLTRYQGLIGRRNAASEGELFDTLLARHRALHDLDEPRALADYRHALDTWQWVLRLAPRAGLALQTAALFHDLEWPRAGEDMTSGHSAHAHQSLKDAHAERSALFTHSVLAELGLESGVRERVRGLILHHERRASDSDSALLHDADALSFFSLHASSFARAVPRARARRTVAHALARLRPQHRWRLARIRLAPAARRLLEEALGEAPLPVLNPEREERRNTYVASP